MTKKELINAVCSRAGINRTEFEHGFNNLIEVIKETITKGEPIYVRGFGTMKTAKRKSMIARDIHKAKAIIIPERNGLVFKPSKGFKKQINK